MCLNVVFRLLVIFVSLVFCLFVLIFVLVVVMLVCFCLVVLFMLIIFLFVYFSDYWKGFIVFCMFNMLYFILVGRLFIWLLLVVMYEWFWLIFLNSLLLLCFYFFVINVGDNDCLNLFFCVDLWYLVNVML